MKKYDYKLISRIGEAGLVEILRNGETERFILPMSVLANIVELTEFEIDAGVQYGLPFEKFVTPSENIIPNMITALHNSGVWTLNDLRTKPNLVIAALQSTYRIDVGRIVQAAETYLQQEHDVKPPVAPKTKTKKEIKQ